MNLEFIAILQRSETNMTMLEQLLDFLPYESLHLCSRTFQKDLMRRHL